MISCTRIISAISYCRYAIVAHKFWPIPTPEFKIYQPNFSVISQGFGLHFVII